MLLLKKQAMEEVPEKKPNIPFPTEASDSHDWYKVGKQLDKVEDEYGSELADHIQDGSDEPVDEILDRLE